MSGPYPTVVSPISMTHILRKQQLVRHQTSNVVRHYKLISLRLGCSCFCFGLIDSEVPNEQTHGAETINSNLLSTTAVLSKNCPRCIPVVKIQAFWVMRAMGGPEGVLLSSLYWDLQSWRAGKMKLKRTTPLLSVMGIRLWKAAKRVGPETTTLLPAFMDLLLWKSAAGINPKRRTPLLTVVETTAASAKRRMRHG